MSTTTAYEKLILTKRLVMVGKKLPTDNRYELSFPEFSENTKTRER